MRSFWRPAGLCATPTNPIPITEPPTRGLRALLAPLYAPSEANPDGARTSLRLVYVALFGFQTLLALTLATTLLIFGGRVMRPNDTVAMVLLAMTLLSLPLGGLLGVAVARVGGVQGALAGTTASAVALSGSSWFAALMLATQQRSVWLVLAVALVAIAYALGFGLVSRRFARLVVKQPEGAHSEASEPLR